MWYLIVVGSHNTHYTNRNVSWNMNFCVGQCEIFVQNFCNTTKKLECCWRFWGKYYFLCWHLDHRCVYFFVPLFFLRNLEPFGTLELQSITKTCRPQLNKKQMLHFILICAGDISHLASHGNSPLGLTDRQADHSVAVVLELNNIPMVSIPMVCKHTGLPAPYHHQHNQRQSLRNCRVPLKSLKQQSQGFQEAYGPGHMGLAAATWVPMGGSVPVLSLNDGLWVNFLTLPPQINPCCPTKSDGLVFAPNTRKWHPLGIVPCVWGSPATSIPSGRSGSCPSWSPGKPCSVGV